MDKAVYKCSRSLLKVSSSMDFSSGGTRQMSRVKRRFTVSPFWQAQKHRVLYPEHITPENQDFLKESVKEKYGSMLNVEKFERGQRTPYSIRCGLITRKIGVQPMWMDPDGKRILTTLLQVLDNHVISYTPPETLEERSEDRYTSRRPIRMGSMVVGADAADPRLFSKEYCNLFKKVGLMPKKVMTKFYITPDSYMPIGTPLSAQHFLPGLRVDCTGITIDRGFQGVMKRWGFKGNRGSHGTTKSHRSGGCIGSGKDMVIAGTKMPGHMGRQRTTLISQEIVKVDTVNGVLYVKGTSIQGETGNYVYVRDTCNPLKGPTPETIPPFPTYFPEDEDNKERPHDWYAKNMHPFDAPSIVFKSEKK